jgi:arsenate reductase
VRAVLTVYEKPTCTTCRKLAALLAERRIDFERVNYYVEPIGEERLRELLRKAGAAPRDFLRTRERPGAADGVDSDDALIAMMAADPDLIQRPIVERGERAVLARPVERVLELLD